MVSLWGRDRQEPHRRIEVCRLANTPGRSRYFSVVEARARRLREQQSLTASAQIQVDHPEGTGMMKLG
jgi:hypothetical protein